MKEKEIYQQDVEDIQTTFYLTFILVFFVKREHCCTQGCLQVGDRREGGGPICFSFSLFCRIFQVTYI